MFNSKAAFAKVACLQRTIQYSTLSQQAQPLHTTMYEVCMYGARRTHLRSRSGQKIRWNSVHGSSFHVANPIDVLLN